MAKNDQLQKLALSPYLGSTAPKNKGGKAATKTLTQLCKEARDDRDSAEQHARKAQLYSEAAEQHARKARQHRDEVNSETIRVVWTLAALLCFNVITLIANVVLSFI